MFREFERKWKKTPRGSFSYNLVSKAQKNIKSYLRELFQSWLAGVLLFRNYSIRTKKVLSHKYTQVDSSQISLVQVDIEQIKYRIHPTFLEQSRYMIKR